MKLTGQKNNSSTHSIWSGANFRIYGNATQNLWHRSVMDVGGWVDKIIKSCPKPYLYIVNIYVYKKQMNLYVCTYVCLFTFSIHLNAMNFVKFIHFESHKSFQSGVFWSSTMIVTGWENETTWGCPQCGSASTAQNMTK